MAQTYEGPITYPTTTPTTTPKKTATTTVPYKPWTPKPITPPKPPVKPMIPASLTNALGGALGQTWNSLANVFGNIPSAVGSAFGQGAASLGYMANTYFRPSNSAQNPTSAAYEHQQRLNNYNFPTPTPPSRPTTSINAYEHAKGYDVPGSPGGPGPGPSPWSPQDITRYEDQEKAKALYYIQSHNPVITIPGPGGGGGGGSGSGGGYGGGAGRGWQYGLINWRI